MSSSSIEYWSLSDAQLRPSRYLPQYLGGAVLLLLACACLWSSSLSWQVCFAVTVTASIYCGLELSRINRLWNGRRLTALHCENGVWWLCLEGEIRISLRLEPGPLVHPLLLAARFHAALVDGPSLRLFLVAVNTEPELWRRLSLGLRYSTVGESTVSSASAPTSG